MENLYRLANRYLEVDIRLPGSEPRSERFDSACQVKQVVLNGMHRFCQPEQLVRDRATCYGFGLCSEFDMNDVAAHVKQGEYFPKPGVGLLRQIRDGMPYDMWSHYEIRPFAKTWHAGSDWIEFEEIPVPCLGVAVRIRKRLYLLANTLTVATTVCNEGKGLLNFSEYQHNFVAIDDKAVDKGYCLEIPYDGTISDLTRSFRNLKDFSPTDTSCVQVEGQKIRWTRPMDGYTYHKVTEAEDILPQAAYRWALTHDDSDASIAEISHFQPSRIVLWGIEHCICTEVYSKIVVQPGENYHFSRTWVFEDARTRA